MNVFEGIEHVFAEGTANKQYFEPGKYTVIIDSVFLHEKRLGGGKLFIVETIVEHSDNPHINAGEQRNWAISLTLPSALPRIKSFIGAALGFCPKRQLKDINSKINSALCNEVVSSKNPLRGKKLNLVCQNKLTRNQKEFTHHSWEVING